MKSDLLPAPLAATNYLPPSMPYGRKKLLIFVKTWIMFFALLPGGILTSHISAQTDFAPGEIMFTGYQGADPERFSFVILRDVVAGTVIYVTDRGFDNTIGDGFWDDNNGEGTISFTFTNNYPCGSEFFFTDIEGANDWQARDRNNNVTGTTSILTFTSESNSQDIDGPELGSTGDQLFIYQLPEPTPSNQSSFVTGIHTGGNWETENNSDLNSEKPSGLATNQVVRFGSNWASLKYDCEPHIGIPSTIQSAITNDNGAGGNISDASNNWFESNSLLSIATPCHFCCGASSPPVPFVSGESPILINQTFTIYIGGTLSPGESWQLFVDGCGIGSPVMTTTSDSFLLTAPATSQTITYYIRSTEDSGCECGIISVCFVSNLNATCTSCSADPAICGSCYLPLPDPNPPLTSGCHEQKLIFILDESGSIGTPINYAPQVYNAVISFLEALKGQEIEAAIIEFNALARVVTPYQVIDDAFIGNMHNYFLGFGFNGQTYFPNEGTNWHDAMLLADAMDPAGLILFFTDGEPTGWTNNGFTDYCSDGSSTQTPEITNPVKISNKLKGEGTHLFMLGVGGGIDVPNLQAMSGPTAYQAGVNDIGSSDYTIGNFATLAEELEEFVFELCETTFIFEKTVSGDPCSGGLQFNFTITNTGTQSATPYFIVHDTFPSGYTNIMYNGPEPKLCIGDGCFPPLPPNAFQWGVFPIAPGESNTATLTAEVLPGGNYQNIAWAFASNGDILSDTVSYEYLITDPIPTIECPDNITLSCLETTLPPATGIATAMDEGNSDPVVTYTDVILNGDCPSSYMINRTWKATDSCMNLATCVQIITIQDEIPPILNCPPDISFQCNQIFTMEETGTATASDNCDPSLTVTFADVTMSGGCVQSYIINRTWMATDACGNQATCLQKISVADTAPPTMNCPNDITIACSSSTLPVITGTAKATDVCDMVLEITYEDLLQGCPENFTLIRTWIATDDCGNSSTCQQVITIQDQLPPQVNCPANVTIQCTDNTSPSFTGQATSSDNCDASPELTHNDVITSGNCASSYSITRTWTSTDEGCNSTTCIQMITVVDNTPPVINCPDDITMTCNSSTLPSSTGFATADDNCDLNVSPVYSDIVINGACPQSFMITRTWTSTDACGNVSTCQQLITLVDITGPGLTCAPNITVDCSSNTLPAVTGQSTASDICDANVAPLFTDMVIEGNCEQAYTINRTWTSTDDCGNSTTCLQVISVVDIVAPVITCPADITVLCNEDHLPPGTGQPVVSDNCDMAPGFLYNDVTTAGPSPNGYTIDRTWTATDACGNTATCLQVIRVENPLDPTVTGFTYDTICSGSSVSFSTVNQSISPVTYSWSFGEGSSPANADGLGPHAVSYISFGSNGMTGAHVLLTVSAAGCGTVTDTVGNVLVNQIPDPTIDATTSPTCYFRLKTFKPLAPQMTGYTYQWNFGAGASIPSINGYGPHHVQYATTGIKTVQLIVISNAAGASCMDTSAITFNVLACPGNITGKVRREDGTPIQGVNVRLFPDANRDGMSDGGVPVRNVNTNSSGIYSMATLIPGQYVIVETQPPDYFSLLDIDESDDNDSTVLVNHPNDNIIPATIEPQEIDSNNVFVDVPNPGIITGYVFQDGDNDDAPDPGEGIQHVKIRLFADDDANGVPDAVVPLDSTVTSNTGWYTFGNMVNGHYLVTETQPPGYLNVKDFDPSVDDDVVPNVNMTDDVIPVTITNGEHDADNHFKEAPGCSHVVTSLNNAGPGSLRYIIECASSGDTIRFHNNLAGEVIYLLERIEIGKNLFIHSDVVPRVMIESQVPGSFRILPATTVEFRNLDVTSGITGTQGAAFENYGHLILWDVSVFKNLLLPEQDYLFFNDASAIISAKGMIKLESD